MTELWKILGRKWPKKNPQGWCSGSPSYSLLWWIFCYTWNLEIL